MEAEARRKAGLEKIQQNIDSRGHHIYVVSGTPDPRFAYTIRLSRPLGLELILAGTLFYMLSDVSAIINAVANQRTEPGRDAILKFHPSAPFRCAVSI